MQVRIYRKYNNFIAQSNVVTAIEKKTAPSQCYILDLLVLLGCFPISQLCRTIVECALVTVPLALFAKGYTTFLFQ